MGCRGGRRGAATSRCKQRVVPAENELKFGLEKVGDHKGCLPARLLGPF